MYRRKRKQYSLKYFLSFSYILSVIYRHIETLLVMDDLDIYIFHYDFGKKISQGKIINLKKYIMIYVREHEKAGTLKAKVA